MSAKDIAKELKTNLENEIPGLVHSVILYGSHARGDVNQYSDLDILLILEHKIDWLIKDKIYDVCSNLNLKYDVWIDVSILSQDDMKSIKGKQPFVQNALREGIAI
jgi:predicted nucleotidyltransferase